MLKVLDQCKTILSSDDIKQTTEKQTTTESVALQGECPPVEDGVMGTCLQECDLEDMESCGDNKMCCSNGCGTVCTEPVKAS